MAGSPTKRDADEARWKQRLDQAATYLAADNQWARHNKTEDQSERTLGVRLHTQTDHPAGGETRRGQGETAGRGRPRLATRPRAQRPEANKRPRVVWRDAKQQHFGGNNA